MKDDILVSTMPIKPQKSTNIGMLIAPMLVNLLSDIYDSERIISMNSLNSYLNKDNELEVYKNDIDKNNIKYDRIFIDKNNVYDILNIIEKLYKDGFLSIKNKEKVVCDCGKVDMLKDALSYNSKLFHCDNLGNIICNSCSGKCNIYSEKELCLELKQDIDDTVSIAPLYLKKEMKAFSKQFKGCDILISKNRNTGYSLMLDGIKFNIDVDFLWNNYFKMFEQDNQILIASNHQLLLMYLMNYLAKITSNKNLTFVANPYVLNKDEDISSKFYEIDNEFYKKLFILYNLKWRQKTCYWSSSIYDYLSKASSTKLLNLYKSIIISSKDLINYKKLSLEEQIDKILIDNTNMQENIKLMKKLYKEGLL